MNEQSSLEQLRALHRIIHHLSCGESFPLTMCFDHQGELLLVNDIRLEELASLVRHYTDLEVERRKREPIGIVISAEEWRYHMTKENPDE